MPTDSLTLTDRRTRVAPADAEVSPAFGLTADERETHRALLDQLARASRHGRGTGTMGLTYAEKTRLGALDLDFIEAEIEKMDQGLDVAHPATPWSIGFGGAFFGLIGGGLVLMGETAFGAGFLLAAIAFVVLARPLIRFMARLNPSSGRRLAIYRDLRDLALPVHDLPDALDRTDILDLSDSVSGFSEAPTARTTHGPARVRS